MDEFILYMVVAFIAIVALGVLLLVQSRNRTRGIANFQEIEREENARPRMPPIVQQVAGGARSRVAAGQNARARMRLAQAQRQQQQPQVPNRDSGSEDEAVELSEGIVLPEGKIGVKKLAKLQLKAEKKVKREADERERKEKKEEEERLLELRKIEEKNQEEEEKAREEEERIRKEEEEKREQEEYEKMRLEFEIDEEGFDETHNEDEEANLLQDFIDYVQKSKVVVLEELAALFKLKTQAVIDRIIQLQADGRLTGVLDDRGKFISISNDELESIAKFIRRRGRVSLADLAEASNQLINLNPESVPVKS